MAPEAAAAAAAPRKAGAMMLAPPNIAPQRESGPIASRAWARKANAAPRSTMPTMAMVSGRLRARARAAKVTGNAVKSPTIMKISQTWFASQTGPMAPAIACRWRAARGPLARMSHTPPPKSAPARTA